MDTLRSIDRRFPRAMKNLERDLHERLGAPLTGQLRVLDRLARLASPRMEPFVYQPMAARFGFTTAVWFFVAQFVAIGASGRIHPEFLDFELALGVAAAVSACSTGLIWNSLRRQPLRPWTDYLKEATPPGP